MRSFPKKSPILLLLLLAPMLLMAQDSTKSRQFDFGFHSRGGYKVEGYRHGEPPRGAFSFDHLMVDVKGTLSPKLSYRYLQRFNKDATTYTLENLSNAIDYAYLRYDFTPRIGVTIGRQALSIGGFEFQEYPIDVFDFSWIGNNVYCYLNGITGFFQLTPTQQVTLQITNNRTHPMEQVFGTDQLEALHFPFYASLGWNSSYFNDLLHLRYAGSYGPLAKGVNGLILGAGHKFNLGAFQAYLDLLYYRSEVDYIGVMHQHLSMDMQNLKQTDYMSAILDLRYHINKEWNIHLKGVVDYGRATMKSGTSSPQHLERQLYQITLQYHPWEGKHLYFYLNGSYHDHKGLLSNTSATPPSYYRASLGLVARLSLLNIHW